MIQKSFVSVDFASVDLVQHVSLRPMLSQSSPHLSPLEVTGAVFPFGGLFDACPLPLRTSEWPFLANKMLFLVF